MKQSETIAKLATALSKAQSMMIAAKKESSNPYFKSKYADLESVWEACREALTANELSVIQAPQMYEETVCLETTLMHSSGEWIRSVMPLFLPKKDPQTLGSAMTYGRRYALAAMVGVVQSDDDGESAMKASRENKQEPVADIPIKQIKKEMMKKMEIPYIEHLEEYLEFVKSKVSKPMKEVWVSWAEKPEPFLAHYQNWVDKKLEAVG